MLFKISNPCIFLVTIVLLLPACSSNLSLTWEIDYPGYETFPSPTSGSSPGQIIRIDENDTIHYVTLLSPAVPIRTDELVIVEKSWNASANVSFLFDFLRSLSKTQQIEYINKPNHGPRFDDYVKMEVCLKEARHEYIQDEGLYYWIREALNRVNEEELMLEDKYYLIKDVISVSGIEYYFDEWSGFSIGGLDTSSDYIGFSIKYDENNRTVIQAPFEGRRRILHTPFEELDLSKIIPEKVKTLKEQVDWKSKSIDEMSEEYNNVILQAYDSASSGFEPILYNRIPIIKREYDASRLELNLGRDVPIMYNKPIEPDIDKILNITSGRIEEWLSNISLPTFKGGIVIFTEDLRIWTCEKVGSFENYRELKKEFDAITNVITKIDPICQNNDLKWSYQLESIDTGLQGPLVCRYRGRECLRYPYHSHSGWYRSILVSGYDSEFKSKSIHISIISSKEQYKYLD